MDLVSVSLTLQTLPTPLMKVMEHWRYRQTVLVSSCVCWTVIDCMCVDLCHVYVLSVSCDLGVC